MAYLQQLTFMTSVCTNKHAEVIDNVYELGGLFTHREIKIDTIDMIHEMEKYRGKISKDIDNVIDW